MKSENKNSKPVNESLLKALDTSCEVDKELMNRLGELSAQEFEQAAESTDSQQPGVESIWRHIMKNRTAIQHICLYESHKTVSPKLLKFFF